MNCAFRRMKRPESERSTPTRRSAQWTGFLWKTTPSAQKTAVSAKKEKRMVSIMSWPSLSLQHQDHGRHGHVEERRRQEHLPAEAHELIVAKPREGRAEPDVAEEEEAEL